MICISFDQGQIQFPLEKKWRKRSECSLTHASKGTKCNQTHYCNPYCKHWKSAHIVTRPLDSRNYTTCKWQTLRYHSFTFPGPSCLVPRPFLSHSQALPVSFPGPSRLVPRPFPSRSRALPAWLWVLMACSIFDFHVCILQTIKNWSMSCRNLESYGWCGLERSQKLPSVGERSECGGH